MPCSAGLPEGPGGWETRKCLFQVPHGLPISFRTHKSHSWASGTRTMDQRSPECDSGPCWANVIRDGYHQHPPCVRTLLPPKEGVPAKVLTVCIPSHTASAIVEVIVIMRQAHWGSSRPGSLTSHAGSPPIPPQQHLTLLPPSSNSPGCQTTAGGMGNVTGILQVVARMLLNTHTQNSPTHGFVWLRKCQLFPLAQLLNQNPMLEVKGIGAERSCGTCPESHSS